MERPQETFDVDTIKHYHSQWETELLRNGVDVIGWPVYMGEVEFDGPVTVEFDEYYSYIRGDMKVTVSYQEEEYEGESYKEGFQIEQVEAFA